MLLLSLEFWWTNLLHSNIVFKLKVDSFFKLKVDETSVAEPEKEFTPVPEADAASLNISEILLQMNVCLDEIDQTDSSDEAYQSDFDEDDS